jgi:hypothetical protein
MGDEIKTLLCQGRVIQTVIRQVFRCLGLQEFLQGLGLPGQGNGQGREEIAQIGTLLKELGEVLLQDSVTAH